MRLNISYRENGVKGKVKNASMSDLIIMHSRPDVIVERCDMVDANGKFLTEFNMSEIRTLVDKYI